MSKYLPLNLKWSFFTKEGRVQWKSLVYRIYINIFGIFLRISILPLSFDWKYKTLNCYYKGDEIMIYIKKGKLRYISICASGDGSFGDATFDSLKEIDNFWDCYFKDCTEISEREDKLFKYRKENELCNEPFCQIEGEHKKHND